MEGSSVAVAFTVASDPTRSRSAIGFTRRTSGRRWRPGSPRCSPTRRSQWRGSRSSRFITTRPTSRVPALPAAPDTASLASNLTRPLRRPTPALSASGAWSVRSGSLASARRPGRAATAGVHLRTPWRAPRTVLTPDKRLGLVLVVNSVMVLALVGVGLAANSLGVLASGADYLGDALGTGLSLAALRMSRRPPGHPRATSFAALVNATLLLLVTLAVIVEAVYRLSAGAPSIDGLPVVLVSVVAAAAMVACALILGNVHGDLNMQS